MYIDLDVNEAGSFNSDAETIDAARHVIDDNITYELEGDGVFVIGKAVLELDSQKYTTMKLNYDVNITSELEETNAKPTYELFYKNAEDIEVKIDKDNTDVLNVGDLDGKELILKAVYADISPETDGIQVNEPMGFTYTITVTCTPVA